MKMGSAINRIATSIKQFMYINTITFPNKIWLLFLRTDCKIKKK